MNCYKCNTSIEQHWNYCPNCKRRLKKKKVNVDSFLPCEEEGKCHVCSTVLSDSWYFCPMCATKVDLVGTKNRINIPTIAGIEKDKKVIVPFEARFSYIIKNDKKVSETDTSAQKEEMSIDDNEDGVEIFEDEVVDTEENRSYAFFIFLAIFLQLLGFIIQSSLISILFLAILPFALLSYVKVAYRDVAAVNIIFRFYIILIIFFLIFSIFFLDGWNTWFDTFR